MPPFRWTRVHTIAAAAAGLVLAGSGVGLAVVLSGRDTPIAAASATRSSTANPPASATPSTPSPRPTPSSGSVDPLTGRKPLGNRVFAAKIENIAAARPQVGLHAADIVFAEEVEGAQTRLIAIYHSSFPHRIGPVRSARTTDVELLPLFGKPGLVYSGANSSVQRKLEHASLVPIQRSTRDFRRVAPHNVFVNMSSIAASAKVGKARSIGWTFAATDPRWQSAGAAEKVSARVGNDTFSFDYAKGRYTVRWNGRSYVDGDSGAGTKTDNVVVMRVHNHGDGNRDVNGVPSVKSDTVGHGTATIYRDGKKVTGTWRRTAVSSPLRFLDGAGRDIALTPGKTWVTLSG